MNETIIGCLTTHAQKYPSKKVFQVLNDDVSPGSAISYDALLASVKRLACSLPDPSSGIDKALLVYQETLPFIISFLACTYAGIVPIPVPYVRGGRQQDRLSAILRDAKAGVVLCTEATVPHLLKSLPADESPLLLATDAATPPSAASAPAACHPIAFIQYTSGSTGSPKGAVISQGNLMHNEELIAQTFGCDENSILLSWLPFHHDMGLIGNILHTIYAGCTCILMSPFQFMQRPRRWMEAISRYKATHSGGPNFAYDLCLDKVPSHALQDLDLSSWKVAYNGAEPIRATTMLGFSSHFAQAGFNISAFQPCYGLAESTLLVAGRKQKSLFTQLHVLSSPSSGNRVVLSEAVTPHTRSLTGSGAIASGMLCRIICPNSFEPCSELEEGEICIAGDSVTEGYWNKDNTSLFIRVDNKDYLRTGDIGFFYNNELFVSGRLKEMMIVRGVNIYPYDVELAVAHTVAAVENNGVVIFGLSEEKGEIVVVAEIKRAFVRELDVNPTLVAIRNLVAGMTGIAPYDIVLTTPMVIPRTTSGKLQRIKCREKYLAASLATLHTQLTMSPFLPDAQGTVSDTPNEPGISPQEVLQHRDAAAIQQYVTRLILSGNGLIMPVWFQPDVSLVEMGIDSLRATELVNRINKDLGITLDMTQVLRENTLSTLVATIESSLWLRHTPVVGKEIII